MLLRMLSRAFIGSGPGSGGMGEGLGGTIGRGWISSQIATATASALREPCVWTAMTEPFMTTLAHANPQAIRADEDLSPSSTPDLFVLDPLHLPFFHYFILPIKPRLFPTFHPSRPSFHFLPPQSPSSDPTSPWENSTFQTAASLRP